MTAADATRVYLEVGKKKAFAAAIDWPGWARSGRDEESALEALASYLARYAPVVRRAGLATPSDVFVVTERIAGSSTTDFGVLEKVAAADSQQAKDANRHADDYMLAVVLFASSLFFAGISTKLHGTVTKAVILGLGCAVFLGTVIWLATLSVNVTS